MIEWNRQGTTIGHLQVRYSSEQTEMDQTTLRLRIEHLLGKVDLTPPGLASGVVLVVRKLDGLAPLEISATGQVASGDWGERLRQQMGALYAAAARPVLGPVSPGASSVLFADTSEMLTCLTRDIVGEQAWNHWYWQQVLRNIPHVTHCALTALWCEHASFVPTVLAALRPEEAYAAVAQLELHEIEQVIYALYKSFELSTTIVTALASHKPHKTHQSHEASHKTWEQTSSATFSEQRLSGEAHAEIAPPSEVTPPWERWLPSRGSLLPTLTVLAHYLLGVSTALYHAPSFARSPGFAAQANVWLGQFQAAYSELEPTRYLSSPVAGLSTSMKVEKHQEFLATATTQPSPEPMLSLGEWEAQLPMPTPIREGEQNAHIPMSMPQNEQNAQLPTPIREDEQNAQSTPTPIPQGTREGYPGNGGSGYPGNGNSGYPGDGGAYSGDPGYPEVTGTTSATGPESIVEPARSPYTADGHEGRPYPMSKEFVFAVTKALPTDGAATALGGVLYLVNLLLWLKLPLSWDEDGVLAEQMGGWAMVEALARGLLGALHEDYSTDLLWVALALLDQRALGVPIAAHGIPLGEHRAFRLPAAWLQRFGSPTWLALVRGERLLLLDEVGKYLIADVPLLGRSLMEVAHAEVEAYVAQGLTITWRLGGAIGLPSLDTSVAAYLSEDACWWVQRVLGFVRYILWRALGEMGEAHVDTGKLATLLLCKYGKLLVSRTHVDLHMSMEEISLPIRRVGLDRDPAWVPDLARIIYFHFD